MNQEVCGFLFGLKVSNNKLHAYSSCSLKKTLQHYIFLLSRRLFVTGTLLLCALPSFSQNIIVRGIIYESDSTSRMQFSYVINKNTKTGTLADANGNFLIKANIGDTLCFSSLGYYISKLHTHELKNLIKNSTLEINIYLKPKFNELNTVMITAHSFSLEQKDLFRRKIGEYDRAISSAFSSPITALYYTFSKKGNELKKLSVLYDQLIIDELKEIRLSDEKIRSITGNDTLNVKVFLGTCNLPYDFIAYASDYELFTTIKKFYKQYMENQKTGNTLRANERK